MGSGQPLMEGDGCSNASVHMMVQATVYNRNTIQEDEKMNTQLSISDADESVVIDLS